MWSNKLKLVTPLSILPSNKKQSWQVLFGFLVFSISILVLWSVWILWNGLQLKTALTEKSFESSFVFGQRIYPTLRTIDTISFKKNHDLHFAVVATESLLILQEQKVDLGSAINQINDVNQEFSYQPFKNLVSALLEKSIELNQLYPRTRFVRQQISAADLNKSLQVLTNADKLLSFLETGDRTFVVLLQNSDEIRATGGFSGSFAFVHTYTNKVPEVEILDIYVPDGQFTGFVQPPPGVEQYLSSGNGLRLPDANWYPDFPTSANQMLRFFAYGNTPPVDGIAAINSQLVEEILQIIGPVQLPDYDQTITSQNLTQIARSDRDSFFAGSQQKTNFLNSLATQLRYQLNNLTSAQINSISKLVLNGAKHKKIQAYSSHSQLQDLFSNIGITGELKHGGDLGIYLVESNVGINKANGLVQRSVEIDVQDYRSELTITFENNNTPQPLPGETTRNYINYYRIFTHPNVEVTAASIDNQPVTFDHSRGFSTLNGENFLETGILVEVPTERKTKVSFTLEHKTLPPNPVMYIFHQPGLPATPYRINYDDKSLDLLIETDKFIDLNNN